MHSDSENQTHKTQTQMLLILLDSRTLRPSTITCRHFCSTFEAVLGSVPSPSLGTWVGLFADLNSPIVAFEMELQAALQAHLLLD
jgi:hypothetical protein